MGETWCASTLGLGYRSGAGLAVVARGKVSGCGLDVFGSDIPGNNRTGKQQQRH
jgi:hypothetical protein